MAGSNNFLTLSAYASSSHDLPANFFIMEDTKIITKDELKELSERYTSPCVNCTSDDGCPSPAECEVYKEWLRNIRKTFTAN